MSTSGVWVTRLVVSVFRVVAMNIDLMPNTSMVYGLYDIRGLDFQERRYLELCEAIGGACSRAAPTSHR